MTNVKDENIIPLINFYFYYVSKIMWFVCKQLCLGAKSSLNMEQVQVKSITAIHLVFWVMLGVTRIGKSFPPQVQLSFIGRRSSIN